jgi:hypothetical protein
MKAAKATIDIKTDGQCPHDHASATCLDSERWPDADVSSEIPLPRLMRVSEIERDYDPASPLGLVVAWIRGFLGRPHPELGRPGLVCPFVPGALKIDSIYLTEMEEPNPTFERLSAIITGYRNVFPETEPKSGPEAMNKVFLVAFPGFGPEGTAVIEKVQSTLKKYFVDMGLLVGEFHSRNDNPGLHNIDFRPLRSPVPMLAIRHLVESDLAFLNRDFYSPSLRAVYLRSYLFRLGGKLSQLKFNEALDGLISAEVVMASSPD